MKIYSFNFQPAKMYKQSIAEPHNFERRLTIPTQLKGRKFL